MYRITPYIALLVAVALLQVLFFDNLGVSVYLLVVVYTAFVAMLPLQTSHLVLLFAGLACGVTMDFLTGLAGLNTIATLAVTFLRPYLVNIVAKKDVITSGGIPSETLMGHESYLLYLLLLVAIHSAVYFGVEALSVTNLKLYILRFVVSTLFSWGFVWLICRVYLALIFRPRS